MVFDYGYRQRQVPNGWVATSVLLLPVLFVPMFDYEVESYLDAYVIDVKNGYLYAHISSVLEDDADTELIFSGAGDELTEAQWARLEATTRDEIARLFSDPQLQRPDTLASEERVPAGNDG